MLARSHVMGLQAAIRSLAQHLNRVAIDDRHSIEDPSERLKREQRRTESARRSVDEITALEAEAERTQNDSLIGFFRAQRAERERWLRDQEKWLAAAEGRILDEPMISVSQEDFEKGLKELADFAVKGFEAVKQDAEKPEGSK